MPPEIRNGLLDMETRPRRVPPPRHPKLAVTTAPVPEPPAVPAEQQPAQLVAVNEPPVRPVPAPKASSLRGAMVYLDSDADMFLRACHEAGGVSASAVIRLALRKLADAQTPADVATELLNGSAAQRTPGRKRL